MTDRTAFEERSTPVCVWCRKEYPKGQEGHAMARQHVADCDYSPIGRLRIALRDLQSDFGEIIINTTGVPWEAAKDQITGITYEHVLNWSDRIKTALEEADPVGD